MPLKFQRVQDMDPWSSAVYSFFKDSVKKYNKHWNSRYNILDKQDQIVLVHVMDTN